MDVNLYIHASCMAVRVVNALGYVISILDLKE